MEIQDDATLTPEQLFDNFLYTESTVEDCLNQVPQPGRGVAECVTLQTLLVGGGV